MKPPAFQFYADDFLAGVADMTQAEVGAYILLLCHQWSRGEIPPDAQRAALIAKGEVPPHVAAKFPSGKNPRLESERQKQADYRAKQSVKGVLSAKARFNHGSTTVQPSGEPQGQPEGNSPSPSPSPSPVSATDSISKTEGAAKPPRRVFVEPSPLEVEAYASEIGYPMNGQAWCDSYAQKGWKVGKTKMTDWRCAVRNWKSQGWLPSKVRSTHELPEFLNKF